MDEQDYGHGDVTRTRDKLGSSKRVANRSEGTHATERVNGVWDDGQGGKEACQYT